MCWTVFSALVVLLLVSSARLLVKLALFGFSAVLSFYFFRRNLFGTTTPLFWIAILTLLFLPGGYSVAVYFWLIILWAAAFVLTLVRYVPEFILLGIVVTTVVMGYVGFLTFLSYHALDAPAFTVYLSILYLMWYAWLYAHPLDELRLRLA